MCGKFNQWQVPLAGTFLRDDEKQLKRHFIKYLQNVSFNITFLAVANSISPAPRIIWVVTYSTYVTLKNIICAKVSSSLSAPYSSRLIYVPCTVFNPICINAYSLKHSFFTWWKEQKLVRCLGEPRRGAPVLRCASGRRFSRAVSKPACVQDEETFSSKWANFSDVHFFYFVQLSPEAIVKL